MKFLYALALIPGLALATDKGNTAFSDSDAEAYAGPSSSEVLSVNKSRVITAVSPPAIPGQAHGCYVPKKGRGRGFASPVFSITPILERDPQCIADREAEAARELARLKAETELELARAARIRAEMERAEGVSK